MGFIHSRVTFNVDLNRISLKIQTHSIHKEYKYTNFLQQ